MKREMFFSAGVLLAASGLQAQVVQYRGETFQFAGATTATLAPWGVETIGSQVVAGKPFSATEERASRQVLGDGTKIETKETNRLFRDEQGRTRIERSGGNIRIFDPVAGWSAELDPSAKTFSKSFVLVREGRVAGRGAATATAGNSADEYKARLEKLQEELAQERTRYTENFPVVKQTEAQIADLQKAIESQAARVDYAKAVATAGRGGGEVRATSGASAGTPLKQVEFQTANGPAAVLLSVSQGDNGSVESLAAQMINGAMAEGTRTTETIPAGKIGNDRAISIVNERWFSNDLRMVVKSTSSDPRFGDTTYQLLNIMQTSPDPSLFQIPVDYSPRK